MTWIDPFAPGDSPQHPANWKGEDVPAALSVEDAIEATYRYRRDHFSMSVEADEDVPREVLESRHLQYAVLLEEFGTPEEQADDAEFVPQPALLRRAALSEIEAFENEWTELFEQYATDGERDPLWVDGTLPDLAELRARADAANPATQPPADELPEPPKGNALKEDWVEYALAVEKARGGTLTFEEADAMTVAALKDAYKPKAD